MAMTESRYVPVVSVRASYAGHAHGYHGGNGDVRKAARKDNHQTSLSLPSIPVCRSEKIDEHELSKTTLTKLLKKKRTNDEVTRWLSTNRYNQTRGLPDIPASELVQQLSFTDYSAYVSFIHPPSVLDSKAAVNRRSWPPDSLKQHRPVRLPKLHVLEETRQHTLHHEESLPCERRRVSEHPVKESRLVRRSKQAERLRKLGILTHSSDESESSARETMSSESETESSEFWHTPAQAGIAEFRKELESQRELREEEEEEAKLLIRKTVESIRESEQRRKERAKLKKTIEQVHHKGRQRKPRKRAKRYHSRTTNDGNGAGDDNMARATSEKKTPSSSDDLSQEDGQSKHSARKRRRPAKHTPAHQERHKGELTAEKSTLHDGEDSADEKVDKHAGKTTSKNAQKKAKSTKKKAKTRLPLLSPFQFDRQPGPELLPAHARDILQRSNRKETELASAVLDNSKELSRGVLERVEEETFDDLTADRQAQDIYLKDEEIKNTSSESNGEFVKSIRKPRRCSFSQRQTDDSLSKSSGSSDSSSDDSVLGLPKMNKPAGEAALSQHLLAILEQRRKRQQEEEESEKSSEEGNFNELASSNGGKQLKGIMQRRLRQQDSIAKRANRFLPGQRRDAAKQPHQKLGKLAGKDGRKRKMLSKQSQLPPLWEESTGKGSPLQTARTPWGQHRDNQFVLDVDGRTDDYRTFTLSPACQSGVQSSNQSSACSPPPANLPEVITLDAPLSHLPIVPNTLATKRRTKRKSSTMDHKRKEDIENGESFPQEYSESQKAVSTGSRPSRVLRDNLSRQKRDKTSAVYGLQESNQAVKAAEWSGSIDASSTELDKLQDGTDENEAFASVMSTPRPGSSALSMATSSVTGQPHGLLKQNPQISQVKRPCDQPKPTIPRKRSNRPTISKKRKCQQGKGKEENREAKEDVGRRKEEKKEKKSLPQKKRSSAQVLAVVADIQVARRPKQQPSQVFQLLSNKEKENPVDQNETAADAKITESAHPQATLGHERARVRQPRVKAAQLVKEARRELTGGGKFDCRDDCGFDKLARYCLVETSKLDMYAEAFVLEDDNDDDFLTQEQLPAALNRVASVRHISPAQLDYVLKVVELCDFLVSFKMFSVIMALCERICDLDDDTKVIMDGLDPVGIERRLKFYKQMFLGSGDGTTSTISVDDLRIELKAGGLSRNMEEQIVTRCDSNAVGVVSFLDYVAYIPLFLDMHENIIDNPFVTLDGFTGKEEYKTGRAGTQPPSPTATLSGDKGKTLENGHSRKEDVDVLADEIRKQLSPSPINDDLVQTKPTEPCIAIDTVDGHGNKPLTSGTVDDHGNKPLTSDPVADNSDSDSANEGMVHDVLAKAVAINDESTTEWNNCEREEHSTGNLGKQSRNELFEEESIMCPQQLAEVPGNSANGESRLNGLLLSAFAPRIEQDDVEQTQVSDGQFLLDDLSGNFDKPQGEETDQDRQHNMDLSRSSMASLAPSRARSTSPWSSAAEEETRPRKKKKRMKKRKKQRARHREVEMSSCSDDNR